MDEPTAALGPQETERTLILIAALARLPQLTHDIDDFSSFDSRNSLILLSPIFATPL